MADQFNVLDRGVTFWGDAPAASYLFPLWSGGTGTVADSVADRGRCMPLLVTHTRTFDRIGVEITTAGEAGSVARLGLYADTGRNYPGALVLDAGTVPGDGATAWKEIIISLTLAPGLYWTCCVPQLCVTTRPTFRVASTGLGGLVPVITVPGGFNVNPAGVTATALTSGGALPASVPAGSAAGTSIPIVGLRAA